MRITLKVWRQAAAGATGGFVTYQVDDATPEMSLPELLDRLNDQLVTAGSSPSPSRPTAARASAVAAA